MRKLNLLLAGMLALVFISCDDEKDETVLPVTPDPEEEINLATIESFSPAYMIEGDSPEIVIMGEYFSDQAAEVELLLTNENADVFALKVNSINDTEILAELIESLEIGSYTLSFKKEEQELTFEEKFVVHGKLTVDPIQRETAPDGSITLDAGSYILLTGENFGEGDTDNKVFLIDTEGNETETSIAVSSNDRVGFLIPKDIILGSYEVKVVTPVQEIILPSLLIIEKPRPEIETISSFLIYPGDELTITGNYFSTVAEENTVSLNAGTSVNDLAIVSATNTELVVKTSESLPVGEYTLRVSRDGKNTFYNDQQIVVEPTPIIPKITSLNKSSFVRGETIIITGENLRNQNGFANINFLPVGSGVTIVRSVGVNTAGTEISFEISDNFRTGSYNLKIEVDGELSDSYVDSITISE